MAYDLTLRNGVVHNFFIGKGEMKAAEEEKESEKLGFRKGHFSSLLMLFLFSWSGYGWMVCVCLKSEGQPWLFIWGRVGGVVRKEAAFDGDENAEATRVLCGFVLGIRRPSLCEVFCAAIESQMTPMLKKMGVKLISFYF